MMPQPTRWCRCENLALKRTSYAQGLGTARLSCRIKTRSSASFGSGVTQREPKTSLGTALPLWSDGGVAVNPNGGLQILVDPGVGPGGIELRLADQFDSFGPGGVEASRVPEVAGLQREHPAVEGRKRLALGHPNRQANFGQFAGVLEFIHVPGDVRIALAVQRRRTQRKGQLAVVAANRLIEHEMHLLAMGAFVIKEQGDDVGGVRRTDQRHGVGIDGGQVILRLAAAIDGRGSKADLAGRQDAGQGQTDQGQADRGQTGQSARRRRRRAFGAGAEFVCATSVESSSNCLGARQITKAASSRPVMCVAMQ